jgi:hypothetical protein
MKSDTRWLIPVGHVGSIGDVNDPITATEDGNGMRRVLPASRETSHSTTKVVQIEFSRKTTTQLRPHLTHRKVGRPSCRILRHPSLVSCGTSSTTTTPSRQTTIGSLPSTTSSSPSSARVKPYLNLRVSGWNDEDEACNPGFFLGISD